MAEIQRLIDQTKGWRDFHRARGTQGQIETLACNVRIKALEDALRALKKDETHG